MPTIRDVIGAFASRDGVSAVILLGRDGLTIDSAAANGADIDGLSALIPGVVQACGGLGRHAGHGDFGTGVIEFEGGRAIISSLSPEALLAVFVGDDVNIGGLLYEIRRHGPQLAGLL